jgi:hypothetical protein
MHPVVLSFDGREIAQHGVDGPYTLSMLFIYDTTSYRLEVYQGEDLHTTAAYLPSQFERPLIMLAGGDETVLDLDGNGRYDLLTISLLVDIALPGDYEANGRLTDPEGGEIAWATDSFSAPGSGTYQIDLLFDGYTIGTHQVDGPYSLHDLTVFNTTGIGSDTFYSSYTTEAYPFTAFEGGFCSIYLPLVVKSYGAGPSSDSLYGHVTDTGLPVAGAELLLRYYNGLTWLTYASTYTDSNGNYEFTNPPDLNSEQYMYVRWYNEGNPSRLSTWVCHYVFSTSGPEARECSFDLDNIDLVSPSHDSYEWLPTTFSWNMRGIATDSYEVNLADMSDYDPYWWTEVGHVNSYVLNSLPSGFNPDSPYGWWMWVYGPDGYGVSYYYHSITFMNSGRSVDVQAIPSAHFLSEDRIEMTVPWSCP